MKPYLVKTPKLVQWIFPKRVWAFSHKEPIVYLTFDDGPIPEVTPWVLSLLKEFDAKATFFTIGDNIAKHAPIFEQLLAEGHSVGNHTYHHLNASKTSFNDYLANSEKAQVVMEQFPNGSSNLFRPPFGKLPMKYAKALQKKGYKIVMWDVLSADFDATISEEKCLQNVLKNIAAGSIVVFHDSLKSEKKLRFVLPKVLAHCKKQGWACKGL